MRRGVAASLGVVLAAWLGAAALGPHAMGPYLAAWLVFLAVPAGALPLVMGAELAGMGGARDSGFLRWLLVLMPAAALLGLPVLLRAGLYPWVDHRPAGFAGAWFCPLWFAVRGVAYLAAWVALALANLVPPAPVPPDSTSHAAQPRGVLCAGGLVLHVVVGTLAAFDWVMSLSPGLGSAGFGLLLMASQMGVALPLALLLGHGRGRARPAGVALLLVAVVWGLLHLTQYLIVWSADLPREIVWYLARDGWLGQAAVWLGVVALLATLGAALLPDRRDAARLAACCLLAANAVGMFWLVTPSLRGSFSVSWSDAGALAMLALALAAMVWAWQPRQVVA